MMKSFKHAAKHMIILVCACWASAEAATISGRVITPGGSPVVNAVASLTVNGTRDTTGPDGRFQIIIEGSAVHLSDIVPAIQSPHIRTSVIEFHFEKPVSLSAVLYDLNGRQMQRLQDETTPATRHVIDLGNAVRTPLATGAYLLAARCGGTTLTWKILYARQRILSATLSAQCRGTYDRAPSQAAFAASDTLHISRAGFHDVSMTLEDLTSQDLGDITMEPLPVTFDVGIMSFNARGPFDSGDNSWANRTAKVCTVINEYAPDVIGFQEFVSAYNADVSNGCPGYAYFGRNRESNGSGESCRIFYRTDRWALDTSNSGDFWFSDNPDTPGSTGWGATIPRLCTYVRLIDRSTGDAFYVYNNHWDHQSQLARDNSARLMIDRIAARTHTEDPFVVTGDMNAGESNSSILYLLGSDGNPLPLSDSYRLVFPDETNVGTFHGFSGNPGSDKIDFIFSERNMYEALQAEIITYNVNGLYPSDHFPVYGQLRLLSARGVVIK